MSLGRRLATPDWLAGWLPPRMLLELEGLAVRWRVDNDTTPHLAAGPVLVWRAPGAPWFVSGGTRAGWIRDHQLGDRDLGGPLQFTSHIGLGLELTRRATLELTWQHTSNADLYSDNDGLDAQSLRLGWQF